jgi:hypothetical protein
MLLGGGHALDVTAGSETINGSGQRSETCTDRTHATRPSGGAIPTLPQGPRMTGRLPPSSTERKCSSSGSLKHPFEPSLFEPKSPLPGNGIFRPETNGPKRRRSSRRGDRETKPTRKNPADSGLIAGFGEISVRTRMRGGAERTRTACQARSRYRTGLSRVIRYFRAPRAPRDPARPAPSPR